MTHRLTTIEQVANANPGNDRMINAALYLAYRNMKRTRRPGVVIGTANQTPNRVNKKP